MTGPLPRGCTYLHILFDNFDNFDIFSTKISRSVRSQFARIQLAARRSQIWCHSHVQDVWCRMPSCFVSKLFWTVSRCFKFQQIDVCFQNPCRILSPSTSVDRKIQGQLDGWREIPQVRHSLSHTFPHLPSCFILLHQCI
jgi:hypothetical protein